MSGIKEINELIAGIEQVAVRGAFVARGGLELKDIAQVIALVQHFDVLKNALDGDMMAEAKDIDTSELVALGARLVEVFNKCKRANKGEDPSAILGA